MSILSPSRLLLVVWCLCFVTVFSAPLPGTVSTTGSGGSELCARAGTPPSPKGKGPAKPNPSSPKSPGKGSSGDGPVTASLALKRANMGAHNEHWILIVKTNKVVLTDPEVIALQKLSPPILASFTAANSARLSVQGISMDTPKGGQEIQGDVRPTPPDVKKPQLEFSSVTFAKKAEYVDWLYAINGKRPFGKEPPSKMEANCIAYLDWALRKLKGLPKADLAKWEAYKTKWDKAVHAATWEQMCDYSSSDESVKSTGSNRPAKRIRLSSSSPGKK